jgi:hypothetical protein
LTGHTAISLPRVEGAGELAIRNMRQKKLFNQSKVDSKSPSMIEIVKYESNYKSLWDDFVSKSKNGSFLFYRDYMEYHSDRFIDSSLMFFKKGALISKKDALIAVMPANLEEDVLYSHNGLTFGGIISDQNMKVSSMLQLFEQLTLYAKALGITTLIYKPIPHIYHKIPAEEDLYALFRFNARLIRRDASTTIFLKSRVPFSKDTRKRVRRTQKRYGLIIAKSYDFTKIMQIMRDMVQNKYGATPTHTGEELNLLASRFPDNIKLVAVYQNDEMLAGLVTYETQNVIHAQYLGSSQQGQKLGAPELIIDYIVNEHSSSKTYFDFGISTEQNGHYLNTGLTTFKEKFGARTILYDFYELDIV